MNRRDFFKTIGAVAAAAAIPASIVAGLETGHPLFRGSIGSYSGIVFKKTGPEFFDYGLNVGVGLSAQYGDRIVRQAVLLKTKDWKRFSEDQRETVYEMIRQTLIERIEAA